MKEQSMSGEAEVVVAAAGTAAVTEDPGALANALRFERAKNKVLLDEIIGLEDEIVNRSMADFDDVVSAETREFWREQLLTNRGPATVALGELALAQQRAPAVVPAVAPAPVVAARRPLHNRALARPVIPGVAAGGVVAASQDDDRAAKIRNRASAISKAERLPFSAAFRRAENEVGTK